MDTSTRTQTMEAERNMHAQVENCLRALSIRSHCADCFNWVPTTAPTACAVSSATLRSLLNLGELLY